MISETLTGRPNIVDLLLWCFGTAERDKQFILKLGKW